MKLVEALANAQGDYILWIRTDSIGDAVLSMPMLSEIKKAYPQIKIAVLCQTHIQDLYESSQHVNQIITFNKQRAYTDKGYRDKIILSLHELKPLAAINSVYSRETITDTFTIECGAQYIVGHVGNITNMNEDERDANNALYTDLIASEGTYKSEYNRHLDFLSGLGINISELKLSIYMTSEDEKFADDVFTQYKLHDVKPIAVLPSAQCNYRVYPWFLEVMEGLKDSPLLIAGGTDTIGLGLRLSKDFSGTSFNLSGSTTLRQTAAIIAKCKLAICSESASAHIACAVGTPNVVVLGGGHFGRFIPYSNLTSAVSVPLSCYGCDWTCTNSSPFCCINEIDPKNIVYAAREALKGGSARPKIYLKHVHSDFLKLNSIDKFVADVDIINLTGEENPNIINTSEKQHSTDKPMKIHVSFSGLGAGNIGDEAMMLGFLTLYNLPIGTTIEVWDKNEPALSVFQNRFEFVDYTDIETCQSLCLNADCVFVVGATIVTEMLSTDWPLRVLGDKYNFCFTHGIPLHVIGTGVDMIFSEEAKSLFHKGFYGIDSWTVRGERSRRVLLGLGINPDKVITAADLAWHTPLNEFDSEQAKTTLSSIGVDFTRPLIGVNVVNEKWLDNHHIKEQLAETLDELIENHGFQIAFFCNETRVGKFYDKEAAMSVMSLMKLPAFFVPNTYYTPIQMISMLSLCRFTISWRYHFTIFSILAGTVPISVLRGDKLTELVNEFNGLHLGRPESITKTKILQTILLAEEHYGKIKLSQKTVVKELRQRGLLNTAFIKHLNVYSFEKRRVVNRLKRQQPGLLWVRIDSIGDALLSIGMLSEIRKKYEAYRITVLCQTHLKELYETCPYVDNIITLDKHKAIHDELYRNMVLKSIRDLNIVVALNSQYSREQLSDFFTIEIGAKEKVAFFGDNGNHFSVSIREKNNLAYSKIVEIYDRKLNELRRNEQFLVALSINAHELKPQMWLSEDDERSCTVLFNSYNLLPEKTITVAPGAQYKYKVYGGLHEALEGLEDYDICVLGGEDAKDIAEKIEKSCKGRVFNLINKTTIRQAAAIIKNSALLVGVDSMAVHIACAFNTPNVAVLGGGHPGRFLPYHHSTRVITLPLNCFGCNWDSRYGINYGGDLNCRYGVCYCITAITPETINSTVKRVLSEISLKSSSRIPSWGVSTGSQLAEVTSSNQRPEVVFESPSVWGIDKKVPQWRLPEDYFYLNHFKITYSKEKPQNDKNRRANKSPYDYLVTAIVSAYKSEKFIRNCLTDLCNQTIGKELEIIVLDANSPENERSIVEDFQKIHSNITYIRTGDRIGVYAAWNMMVKLAKGKYITPMSTNDRLRTNAYEILAGYLEQFPETALVYGNTYRTKNPYDSFDSHSFHSEFSWPEYLYEQLLQFNLVGPHPMWRTSVHEEVGVFDETYVANGDQEFFLRLGSRYELLSVPEYTGLYWLAPDALSVEGKTPEAESDRAHKKYQEMYIKEMTAILTNTQRSIYIWGAGHAGKQTFSILTRCNIKPDGFVDSDSNKWGTQIDELTVYSPAEKVMNLSENSERPYIIIASLYFREIIIELKRAGYAERRDFFTNIYTMKWIS